VSHVATRTYKERLYEKIDAGKMVKKMQAFVLASPSDDDWLEVAMTQGQVTAARILISKILPDLKTLEVKGDVRYDGDPATLSREFLASIVSGTSSFNTPAEGESIKQLN